MNISEKILEKFNQKVKCPKCKTKIKVKKLLKGVKCPECGYSLFEDENISEKDIEELKNLKKTIAKLNITIGE